MLLIFTFSGCKKTSEPEKIRETGTLTDVEGNVYNTVKIGDQWWMAEDLRVKVYNDKTPIVEVNLSEADSNWANKKLGAFCNLDSRYGLYYNWFVFSDKRKKIAPVGWHIPSDNEWKILEKELGMSETEADKTSWRGTDESEKLMPEDYAGWPVNPAVFGNNESGFSALPGGCRLFNGARGEITFAAYWWSATQKETPTAWYRSIHYDRKAIFRYYADKNYGMHIRCVKN